MKAKVFAVISLCLLLFAAAPVMAQSESPADSSEANMQAMMEEYIRMAQPGEEHRMLASLEGRWNMDGKIWPSAGMEPMPFKGIAFNEMILGGRFLMMTSESGEGDMYTETLSLFGFDNRSQKYTMAGFDTWGTYFITAAGTYDDSSKAITMYGEDIDPAAGFTQKYDNILRMIDENDRREYVYV